MLIRYSFALTAAVTAVPALSADLTLKLQLPRMDIAEYHKPYVAAWIEKASDQSFAGNVALWYDVNKRNNGGASDVVTRPLQLADSDHATMSSTSATYVYGVVS